MVAIPAQPPVTIEDLIYWDNLKKRIEQECKPLIAQEMLLRKRIAASFFPQPKEGTNTYALPNNFALKYVHGLDRKIDKPLFDSMLEEFQAAGFYGQALVKLDPKLDTTKYRELTAEQQQLFDRCLIIKPESPTVTIVEVKKKGS